MNRSLVVCWVLAASTALAAGRSGSASEIHEFQVSRPTERMGEQVATIVRRPLAPSRRADPTPEALPIIFKPPPRGAPVGRIAGGTRGVPGDRPTHSAQLPEATRPAVQEQPSLGDACRD